MSDSKKIILQNLFEFGELWKSNTPPKQKLSCDFIVIVNVGTYNTLEKTFFFCSDFTFIASGCGTNHFGQEGKPVRYLPNFR